MSNAAAIKLTAEIVVDTLKHMAEVNGVTYNEVVLAVFGDGRKDKGFSPNAREMFNKYIEIAIKEASRA